MKTITGKGLLGNGTCRWLAVVPDDARSCTDPRGTQILAPSHLGADSQSAWLEGYAAAIIEVQTQAHHWLSDEPWPVRE